MRVIFAVAITLALAAEVAVATSPQWLEPPAGVEQRGEWVLNGADIRSPRNIQGGYLSAKRSTLNLDIGAGSTAHPGDLVLNYDIGRRVRIYDGRKRLVAEFGRRRIVFHRRVLFRRGFERR